MEQHVIQTSDVTPCHGPGFMGEGQVAMSNGSCNKQQGGPHCNTSWVGTGRVLCSQACPLTQTSISKEKNTDLQPLLLWGFCAAQFEVVTENVIYHSKTQKTKNKKIFYLGEVSII